MEKTSLAFKIEGPRIILKKHEERLAETMFFYVDKDRERLAEFLPWVPKIKTIADELSYIRQTHLFWAEGARFDYGIFRKSDDLYMGNIGLHTIQWDIDQCEIGYWILDDFEGQGYMSEALRTLEDHVFSLGFQRIEVRCSSLNQRSAHVPKACGYVFEGVLQDNKDEKYQNRETWVFSKLVQNYKNGL